jgi:predicted neutral ceramidase superfamily lipid hydrolase
MFDATNRIQPVDARRSALLIEVLARVNEMVKHRYSRISVLGVSMPGTLWAVMVIASSLSFALLYVLPATPFNVMLISSWALTLGLAFFFVLAVDRPFAGEISVSPAPFQQTIDSLVASGIWGAEKGR